MVSFLLRSSPLYDTALVEEQKLRRWPALHVAGLAAGAAIFMGATTFMLLPFFEGLYKGERSNCRYRPTRLKTCHKPRTLMHRSPRRCECFCSCASLATSLHVPSAPCTPRASHTRYASYGKPSQAATCISHPTPPQQERAARRERSGATPSLPRVGTPRCRPCCSLRRARLLPQKS